MTEPSSTARVAITVDRRTIQPLSEQIYEGLRAAILEGRIERGARLPSWRDLAAQLGVARGTVRMAYERLIDEALIVASGAAGTHVASNRIEAPAAAPVAIERPLQDMFPDFSAVAVPFQMGVPAQDGFPAKLWSRVVIRIARESAAAPVTYPDPRGRPELRTQIASYLAIARGIRCIPEQVIVTNGYRAGLAIAIRALALEGREAWMEDPGFPITRRGIELAGLTVVPVRVDHEGIDVAHAVELSPRAALAVVTPSQQAPTGVALSQHRREALLQWAEQSDGWIVEDDYLSELQLHGRATGALAAQDRSGRVIHIGSFSKTLSPALTLGFMVVPVAVAAHFANVAAYLMPASNITTQLAVAQLMAEGHYLRHLRRMKRLYVARRESLRNHLAQEGFEATMTGLAMLLRLPSGTADVAIALAALQRGIAPVPLSPWYAHEQHRIPGLLLGVTNLRDDRIESAVGTLKTLLAEGRGV